MPPVLRLDDIHLAYGSRPLLDGVSLQVEPRERVCLVGRNGEGKSSLLRLISGEARADEGVVWVRPGARVAFLAQDLGQDHDGSVEEVVAGGLRGVDLDAWSARHRIDTVMSRLGLDAGTRFNDLSGGWRRRALLGRALVCEPEILLLDEPTNHLDISAVEWLEVFMRDFQGALLFVSHDRMFVNRLATRIVDLDRGHLSSWPGNYDSYAAKKDAQLRDEVRANALFDKKLAQEEVWIRKGVEARRTRNEGRVRALQQLRRERRERRERIGGADFSVQQAEESSRLVFEAEQAAVTLGGRTIFAGLTTRIMRGEHIGIVGANGAGKTTLIKLLLGEIEPSSGVVRRGARQEVAYYDQQREQLDLDESVMNNVTERSDFVQINGQNRHVSGYLADFLFRPEQLRTPARALSGGERNRLLLARLFARPANLLVLDEPTNDLDIDTLELLEELISEFPGTLLLVSHDRALLDHVVTGLLVIEEGRVLSWAGGYSDWAEYRDGQRARSAPAAAPAAVKPQGAAAVRKLSYKLQRELEQLPSQIEQMEQEKSALEATVQDPQFYGRPHEEVTAQLARLTALNEAIDAGMARWLELETAQRTPGSP